jgi:hypothetical protein
MAGGTDTAPAPDETQARVRSVMTNPAGFWKELCPSPIILTARAMAT